MTAHTWALVSDELMDSSPEWEQAGLHVLEPGPYEYPGMRWWKFLDDEAPESLEGTRIEYLISRTPDGPKVTGRRPA